MAATSVSLVTARSVAAVAPVLGFVVVITVNSFLFE